MYGSAADELGDVYTLSNEGRASVDQAVPDVTGRLIACIPGDEDRAAQAALALIDGRLR
jgi:hypothetical protein